MLLKLMLRAKLGFKQDTLFFIYLFLALSPKDTLDCHMGGGIKKEPKSIFIAILNFRSPLTVAISRARVNPEKSLEMIQILVEELKADVNEKLLWKSSSSQETKEFTPLIWAVLQNQPGIVQFLLDNGADENFWGCCLGKSKGWFCGTALEIAREVMIWPF